VNPTNIASLIGPAPQKIPNGKVHNMEI